MKTLDDGLMFFMMVAALGKGWVGLSRYLLILVKSVTNLRPPLGFWTKNAGLHQVVGVLTGAMIPFLMSSSMILSASSLWCSGIWRAV